MLLEVKRGQATAGHTSCPAVSYWSVLQRNPGASEPEAPARAVACGHRRHLLAVPVERAVVAAALVDAPVLPVHGSGAAIPIVVVLVAARRARRIAWRPRLGGRRAESHTQQS